jgi:hypothetical protein
MDKAMEVSESSTQSHLGAGILSNKAEVVGLVFIFLFSILCCLPFMRTIYWFGDEGILLHGAEQLLSGKLLYRDFWEFYPPAGFLITEGWMSIFGQSFESIRSLAVVIVVCTTCFSYLGCLLVSGDVLLAVVLVVFGMMATRIGSTAIIHHGMTTMLSVAATWLALVSIKRKGGGAGPSFLAGLVAGTAAVITSTRGVYAIVALLATFGDLRRFRTQLLASFIGCFVVPVLCLLYIFLNGEFGPAYDDIVRFTLSSYSSIQGMSWGEHYSWLNGTKDIFPAVGLLALITIVVSGREALGDPAFRCCVFFALAGFIGVFPRPDIPHIRADLPLALPLIAYCWPRLATRKWPLIVRWAAAAVFVLVFAQAGAPFFRDAWFALRAPSVATAVGPVKLMAGEKHGGEQMIQFVQSQPASDRFLFYPYLPMVPYLTQRQEVPPLDLTTPEYTKKHQYFDLCTAATSQANWVVVDTVWADPKHWQMNWPAIKNPTPPETVAFEQAIAKNFSFVSQLGEFQIRKRLPTANATDCNNILTNTSNIPHMRSSFAPG